MKKNSTPVDWWGYCFQGLRRPSLTHSREPHMAMKHTLKIEKHVVVDEIRVASISSLIKSKKYLSVKSYCKIIYSPKITLSSYYENLRMNLENVENLLNRIKASFIL